MLNIMQFTQAERQQLDQMDAKQFVLDMFGWTAEKYHVFQYNAAQNYLVFYTNNDSELIDRYTRCKSFWAWWKNGFANRDVEFMYWDLNDRPSEEWFSKYLEVHDTLKLSQTIYPGAAVWDEIRKEERL